MKMQPARFNLYLLVLLTALTAFGCRTPEERKRAKEASGIRLFLETPNGGDRHSGVPIFRTNSVYVSVERTPFLTEADLDTAEVIDMVGGFSIRAQFNGHAALLLENITLSNKGRRIAIQGTWTETRWLGAPMITRRITNGEITFTPDATREEAERIVRGLTNVVYKMKLKDSRLF